MVGLQTLLSTPEVNFPTSKENAKFAFHGQDLLPAKLAFKVPFEILRFGVENPHGCTSAAAASGK